jgi:hypothetical protein
VKRLITLIFLLAPQATVAQKSDDSLKWFKGNTHTHSYWSDGDDFPEMIMDWYKTHGYDFICLSDHNTLAHGEKWKLIPDFPAHERRFREYLNKYGEDWVVYEVDSAKRIKVKLKTLEEYKPVFEEKDKFLIVQSEEITDGFDKKPVHINAINVKEAILPRGGSNITEVMQNNLNAVHEQRLRTGQAMFAHINHPNFMWGISLEDMMKLNGDRFFEIYNGHPLVHNYGDSTRPGTEEMWDLLLINGIKKNKPLLYGLATDDSHNYLSYSVRNSNPGRGYVMVRAKDLTASSIVEAMESGNFYSSTGVELEDIEVKKGNLSIRVKGEPGVTYTIQFIGAKKDEENPRILHVVNGSEAKYKFRKRDAYVRAKVISSKYQENPFREGDFETAWSQPCKL